MSFASEQQERFQAIFRAATSMLTIPEEIKEHIDLIYLKSFKQSEDIIETASLTVVGGTKKESWVSFSNYPSIHWRVNERNNIRIQSVGITCVNSLP